MEGVSLIVILLIIVLIFMYWIFDDVRYNQNQIYEIRQEQVNTQRMIIKLSNHISDEE
jgi:hypothetical protein